MISPKQKRRLGRLLLERQSQRPRPKWSRDPIWWHKRLNRVRRIQKPRAALTVVQCQQGVAQSLATAITVTISTTSGNLLVIHGGQGANSTSTATISDTASQTWTQVGSNNTLYGSRESAMFYKANSAAVTSVTMTWSGGLSTSVVAFVLEISGAATVSPLDASASNVGSSTSVLSLTSGAITTTNANDILIYAVHTGVFNGQTWTPGSGFAFPTNGTHDRGGIQYEIISATQSATTTSMSWGNAVAVGGIYAAFKAAAGGTIIVIDAPEETVPGQASSSAMLDAQDSAGILPLPPRSQQFEEGEASRSYDWRVAWHDADESDRVPTPPVSQQFEEGETSRTFDWRMTLDDSTESSTAPPVPVFAQEELEQPNRSLDSWMRMDDSTESSRAPNAPLSIQEDYDLSYWRDIWTRFDDGTESQKLPVVIAVTPTAADEAFEARSWDWRAVFDDSTESSSAPPAPVSLQDDGDFQRSTDYRVVVDDSTEASKVPTPVVAFDDLVESCRSFDRALALHDEDYSQKVPVVIVVPTTATDDMDSLFIAASLPTVLLDQEWSTTAPPPPRAFPDDDQNYVDWNGQGRFSAAMDDYDSRLLPPTQLGPFVGWRLGGSAFPQFAGACRVYPQMLALRTSVYPNTSVSILRVVSLA